MSACENNDIFEETLARLGIAVKPCPFCGEEREFHLVNDDKGGHFEGIHVGTIHSLCSAVQCSTCRSHGPKVYHDDLRIELPDFEGDDDHSRFLNDVMVQATLLAVKGWNSRTMECRSS